MVEVNEPPKRWRRLSAAGAWALRFMLAAVFLLAAAAKLAGHPKMVAEFGVIGLGQGFRIFTGLVEVAGALLLFWPRTAFAGAIILLGVCAGAFAAQAGPLHGDLMHVVVLALLLALAAWSLRPLERRINP
ncbi:DoxX family protein [Phenylobacterium montanum]|uniref:DoxX family protein n=1 Tax=Phenylobacterium montanum TaxID=2823693 RepID=A0A975IX78_9CAUL|nr:DoxX family protein [Caulobacter sp. S6]QUD90344.1 DoxX family protein [Caulobacter sp. S6]